MRNTNLSATRANLFLWIGLAACLTGGFASEGHAAPFDPAACPGGAVSVENCSSGGNCQCCDFKLSQVQSCAGPDGLMRNTNVGTGVGSIQKDANTNVVRLLVDPKAGTWINCKSLNMRPDSGNNCVFSAMVDACPYLAKGAKPAATDVNNAAGVLTKRKIVMMTSLKYERTPGHAADTLPLADDDQIKMDDDDAGAIDFFHYSSAAAAMNSLPVDTGEYGVSTAGMPKKLLKLGNGSTPLTKWSEQVPDPAPSDPNYPANWIKGDYANSDYKTKYLPTYCRQRAQDLSGMCTLQKYKLIYHKDPTAAAGDKWKLDPSSKAPASVTNGAVTYVQDQ